MLRGGSSHALKQITYRCFDSPWQGKQVVRPKGECVRILGINAVFHDSAAAVVVDGRTVAAAEEERFSRRKHAKRAVPFSTWELPDQAIAWCLDEAGLQAGDLDAVGYSYDPALVDPSSGGLDPTWEGLRTTFATRAPQFLKTVLPGYPPEIFTFVRHHVAHAASAGLAAPFGPGPTSMIARCWSLTVVASRQRCSPGSIAIASSTSSRHSGCRTRWDCSTRTSLRILASSVRATSTKSWRWPRTAHRDTSDFSSSGLRHRRRRLPHRARGLGRARAGRQARNRFRSAARRPRLQCSDRAGGSPP